LLHDAKFKRHLREPKFIFNFSLFRRLIIFTNYSVMLSRFLFNKTVRYFKASLLHQIFAITVRLLFLSMDKYFLLYSQNNKNAREKLMQASNVKIIAAWKIQLLIISKLLPDTHVHLIQRF